MVLRSAEEKCGRIVVKEPGRESLQRCIVEKWFRFRGVVQVCSREVVEEECCWE